MGNLILCCINVQLEHTRQIDINPTVKRCVGCGLVQHSAGPSCQSCGCQTHNISKPKSHRRMKNENEEDESTMNQVPIRARETDEILQNIDLLHTCRQKKKEKTNKSNSDTSDAQEEKDRIVKDALESIQCPICLESFSGVLTLPCGHSLCESHAMDVRGNCPICRKGFTTSVKRNVELEGHVKSVLKLVKSVC